MPHSHHSHSGQFCKHATGLLESVVLEAVRQGFEVYGLTEHVPRYGNEDLYPEEEGLPLDVLTKQFEDFLDEAHRLKALYASRITLLVGLETEFIRSADLDGLEELLERHRGRIEYVVGSIHHVNGIPIDFDLPTFRRSLNSVGGETLQSEQQGSFLSSYFDAQYELLRRFYPEVVGHLDLCRLYTPNLRLHDYPLAWQKLERNILFAIEYGALFELNAAAFKKGWNSAYPAEDVVELVLKHGGRFALSDDSHGPHQVGLNYDRCMEYLRRVSIMELSFLQKSPKPNIAGRSICPIKVVGNWWEHSFWNGRSSAP